jgi:anti-sigma-K factor RskA
VSDTDPPDDNTDVLAGEYSRGLLPPAPAAAAAARVQREPEFAAAVEGWAVRLMPLAESLPQIAPRPQLWAAIAAKTAPTAPRRRVASWRGWARGGAIGLGMAALAAVLFVTLRPAAPTTLAMATLASPSDGTFVATAQRIGSTIRLVVAPQNVSVPAGRVAELWVIAPGAPPRPLTLLGADRTVDVTYTGAALPAVTLAVSLEPPGGSPTGLPTGPVIASGTFKPL